MDKNKVSLDFRQGYFKGLKDFAYKVESRLAYHDDLDVFQKKEIFSVLKEVLKEQFGVTEDVKKLNINVFGDYLVNYKYEYSFINEDRDFSRRKGEEVYKIDGGKFIELIAKQCLSSNFIEMVCTENQIYISLFDPHTGEDGNHVYKFQAIRESK